MTTKIVDISSKEIDQYRCYVLGYGHFTTIHPGHIRYLKYAKEQGEKLIIGLIGDGYLIDNQYLKFKQKDRADSLSLIGIIDLIVLLKKNELEKLVNLITPKVLILGNEFNHSTESNIKLSIKSQKERGDLIKFHAGETNYATSDLLKGSENELERERNNQFKSACYRQNISKKNILKSLNSLKKANLLILGDTIVDQYAACEPLGMSAEAPVIVVKELDKKNFIGGAAVVASHIKALGAKCSLISVVGNDSTASLVHSHLNNLGIGDYLITDPSRPTTFKKRYIVENQKLFRVSRLENHSLDENIEAQLIKKLEELAPKVNGIVVSDFVYGVITSLILEKIKELSIKYNLMLFGDLQCSSQVGDIRQFKNFHLLCPNEREARIALKEKDSGLETLSRNLISHTSCRKLIMKLGSNGFIAYDQLEDNSFSSQAFPALSVNPLDVTGAGDSLLAVMASGLASGESMMSTAAIGCCMASLAVENMGNNSISFTKLEEKIENVMNDDS